MMGRKNNVNPDHFKEQGRERPGQDINQEIHKQKLTQTQDAERDTPGTGGSKYIPEVFPDEPQDGDVESDIGQISESANSSSKT